MKVILYPGVFFALCIMLSGCDFLRTLAGRPTSKDIEAKKAAIERVRILNERKVQDSLNLIKRQVADSIASVKELAKVADIVHATSRTGVGELKNRYYIIVGTFSQETNARNLASDFERAGYQAILLPYRNNYTAVALCPTDSAVEIKDSFLKLCSEPSVPQGIWILVKD